MRIVDPELKKKGEKKISFSLICCSNNAENLIHNTQPVTTYNIEHFINNIYLTAYIYYEYLETDWESHVYRIPIGTAENGTL